MADHTDALKGMLQDIINNREEQATVTMHDYFVAKTREVAGLAQAEEAVVQDDNNFDDDNNEDE